MVTRSDNWSFLWVLRIPLHTNTPHTQIIESNETDVYTCISWITCFEIFVKYIKLKRKEDDSDDCDCDDDENDMFPTEYRHTEVHQTPSCKSKRNADWPDNNPAYLVANFIWMLELDDSKYWSLPGNEIPHNKHKQKHRC